MVEIQFVGTGDAFGSGGRRNSAILVRDAERTLLLDCGPTTLLGLKDLGVDPLEIDAIAISHFHGDHAAGIPFLMIDYLYQSGRERPLEISGPPGIEERIAEMMRIFGYQTEDKPRFRARYHEFHCDKVLELAGFAVTPVPAFHHPETCPHMLRLETADKAICFSGDTGWTEDLPARVGDVSLFITECTMMEEGFKYHLSHERIDRERRRFQADRIVLTHLGSDVIEARDRVQFETADDGLRIKV